MSESTEPMRRDCASPRPWRLLDHKVPGYERYLSVVHGDNLGICQMAGAGSYNPKVLQEVEANAALIIEAVNAHDELKAEVERLRAGVARAKELRAEWDGLPVRIAAADEILKGFDQ